MGGELTLPLKVSCQGVRSAKETIRSKPIGTHCPSAQLSSAP